jgi:hypothetical protein
MYLFCTCAAEEAFQVVHLVTAHSIGLESNAEFIIGNAIVQNRVVHPKAHTTDDVEYHGHANGTKQDRQLESDRDKGRQ